MSINKTEETNKKKDSAKTEADGQKQASAKTEKKPIYIRCPRCELNYIQKKDKLCSVCKAEVSNDKDELEDDLDLELCPICKTNYIQTDEIMCASCLSERSLEKGDDAEDEWEDYINRDEDEIIAPDEETGDMVTVTELEDEDLLEEEEDIVFDEDEEIDEEFDDESEEDEEEFEEDEE